MTGFFTKLDAGITDSTVWMEPDGTRITWITMLAMSDQHGYVGASIPGLASRARVSIENCIAALETFKSPDPYSRTKDHDGRRIADADGGWVLLNHAKYRAKQSADARRERSRIAMSELRANRRATKQTNANGLQKLTKLPQAEADTDTDKKTDTADQPDGFESVYQAYPKKVGKPAALKAWKAQKINGEWQEILEDIKRRKESPDWQKNGGQYIPNPATYLNQRRWEDVQNIEEQRPFI